MVGGLRRLGLLQEKMLGSEAVEEKRWEIKRLMISSGNLGGLLLGRYYASHKRFCGSIKFWLMEFNTLQAQIILVEYEESPIKSDVKQRSDSNSS